MNTAEFKVKQIFPCVWEIKVAGIDNSLWVMNNNGEVKFLVSIE